VGTRTPSLLRLGRPHGVTVRSGGRYHRYRSQKGGRDGTSECFCGKWSHLNEIGVSRRETLGGLTQFCGPSSPHTHKPLTAKQIEDRFQRNAACAIISARPRVSR
jgi:hypothetical protein